MKFKQWKDGDVIPDNMIKFKSQVDCKMWLVPNKSCLNCDYCTDVWIDWHGPYGVICNINKDVIQAMNNNCPYYTDTLTQEEAEKFINSTAEMVFIGDDE